MEQINEFDSVPELNKSESNKKAGPRDVFFHLLAIIMLYFTATSLGTMLFQCINLLLPDPLINSSYQLDISRQVVRVTIAILIITFPVYIWINWFLNREIVKTPEKKELRSRKWLLNLALFSAALVIIADLIFLIYNFLAGGLILSFILKILIVFLIASSIFIYYLWNLYQEKFVKWNKTMKIFIRSAIILVVLIIISSFFLIGSPKAERARRFDVQRINDLQNIQSQIISFWQQKEHLPKNLDELKNNISGFYPSIDPESKKSYEYRIISDLEFELCANFNTKEAGLIEENQPVSNPIISPTSVPNEEININYSKTFNNWQYEIGRFCFQRKIDPEMYKKNNL